MKKIVRYVLSNISNSKREREVHRMKKKLSLLVMLAVLVFGSSMTVNAQPKTMADGTVFDAEYYANTYADVKAAFGNDEKALYNHYLQYGKAEGRLACASEKTAGTTFAGSLTDNFDAKYYAKNNPDVVKALGNDEKVLYQHYLEYGKSEGRLPNSLAVPKTTESSANSSNTVANSKRTTNVTVSQQNESTGTLVWVPTNGGKKYHSNSSCSGMKNPKQESIETAIANGFTACKKCY